MTTPPTISYDLITSNFNDLVSRGVVAYTPSEIVRLDANGYKVSTHPLNSLL